MGGKSSQEAKQSRKFAKQKGEMGRRLRSKEGGKGFDPHPLHSRPIQLEMLKTDTNTDAEVL
jgi:hypothetical protein